MPPSQRTSGKNKSKKPGKPSEQSSPGAPGGAGADADNWWEKSDLDSAMKGPAGSKMRATNK